MSTPLAREGEMCDVSQDEILMQEHRDNERNAGTSHVSPSTKHAAELTEELELEHGEKADSDSYLTAKQKEKHAIQRELDDIDRMPENCDHHNPVYNVFAHATNHQAERMLNLVHTEQSMRNAKASITDVEPECSPHVSSIPDEEFTYDLDAAIPDWVSNPSHSLNDAFNEVKLQYLKTQEESRDADNLHKQLAYFHIENLKLNSKVVFGMVSKFVVVKEAVKDNSTGISSLDSRLSSMEAQLFVLLANQVTTNNLLLQIFGHLPSSSTVVDDNK